MRQQSLFPSAPPAAPRVPGLSLCRDYVDVAEERALIADVDAGAWNLDFKRRVQLYGLGYGDGGETAWVRDFPPWLEALAQRLVRDQWLPRAPDNCVINDYAPGVGIGPHIDFPAFDAPVVALSLLSDVIVSFARRGGDEAVALEVPARSLWVARGEARWAWTHAIAARRSDVLDGERRRRERRVSITFRVARAGPARPTR